MWRALWTFPGVILLPYVSIDLFLMCPASVLYDSCTSNTSIKISVFICTQFLYVPTQPHGLCRRLAWSLHMAHTNQEIVQIFISFYASLDFSAEKRGLCFHGNFKTGGYLLHIAKIISWHKFHIFEIRAYVSRFYFIFNKSLCYDVCRTRRGCFFCVRLHNNKTIGSTILDVWDSVLLIGFCSNFLGSGSVAIYDFATCYIDITITLDIIKVVLSELSSAVHDIHQVQKWLLVKHASGIMGDWTSYINIFIKVKKFACWFFNQHL